MLLYGKNSVYERLKMNPRSVEKVLLEDTFNDASIEDLIRQHRIACERLSTARLSRIKRGYLQGIVAKVDVFRYHHFDDLLANALAAGSTPLFLDRVFDPQNVGALMRTAACFGNFVLILPKTKACQITETVLHIASGAENHIPVATVTNISRAIVDAQEKGFWIMGTVVEGQTQDITDISIPWPVAVVLGSEGKGIRYGVGKHIDLRVRIPMQGAQLSFNVSVAGALVCYEITRQRSAIARQRDKGVRDETPGE